MVPKNSPKNQSRRKQDGLTLVEVMVALAVVALAVVILGYMTGALRDLRISQARTGSINVARSYLDAVRALWSSDIGGTGTASYASGILPTFTPPSGYSYSVEATSVDNGAAVASCNSPCAATSTTATAPDLTRPLRLVQITVTDTAGMQTVLSTQIARVDP